jgi:alpha-L-fucosidase
MGLKKEQVESLRLLDGGRAVPVSTSWVHSDYPEILFADLGADPILPDAVDTVLEVSLKG